MRRIWLSNGGIATVDNDDFDLASRYKWRASRRRTVTYAVAYNRGAGRRGKPHQIYLHRLVMQHRYKEVDHVNGNGLDCCKSNLRPATTQQNRWNRRKTSGVSKYKGVSFRFGRWRATIRLNNKHIELGYLSTEKAAARVYDRAARKYFGEFARTNFKCV